jgi:hypothetical protein
MVVLPVVVVVIPRWFWVSKSCLSRSRYDKLSNLRKDKGEEQGEKDKKKGTRNQEKKRNKEGKKQERD